jgi:CRISPR type I-D-associated protein Csc2
VSAFDQIQNYLLDAPHPLIGAETIQILLIREILDYTVLRTEETRDLNVAQTPLSMKNPEPVRRVAFLATKQKAAESRELEHMLRTARRSAELEPVECYLKDNLCLRCPRCGLFGAVSTASGQAERANIKHRIEYSTAFSLVPFEEIESSTTFNAINDRDQTTGQALGQRNAVVPATLFPSVITLKSATQRELILTIKTLLSCKSYGAESRIGGDARNHIVGVVAGWEELITALELSLELYAQQDELAREDVKKIVEDRYKPLAAHQDKVRILDPNQIEALISECAEQSLDREFIEAAYRDIAEYRGEQIGG